MKVDTRLLMRTNSIFLLVNMAASAAKFKWKDGMVDDLLRSLFQFKSNMEYRNLDFNADKPKQHEAVREAMARKYSSVDESWFGPETVTSIPVTTHKKKS